MSDRKYSRKELKRIMDRALRLQGEATEASRDGHSLDELISIGRELGIDADAIRRAAGELDEYGGTGFGSRLAGGEMVQTEQQIVRAALTPELAEEISTEISAITGLPGSASVAGRRVSWQSGFLVSQQRAWTLSVSVAPHGEGSRVTIEGRNGMLAGALFRSITRSRRRRISRMASHIREILTSSEPPQIADKRRNNEETTSRTDRTRGYGAWGRHGGAGLSA